MSIHGQSEKQWKPVDTVRWRPWRGTTAGRVLTNDWGAHYVTRVYKHARPCVVVVRAQNAGVSRVRGCMSSGNQGRMMKIMKYPSAKHRNYSNGEHEGEEEKEEQRNYTHNHVRRM